MLLLERRRPPFVEGGPGSCLDNKLQSDLSEELTRPGEQRIHDDIIDDDDF